MASPLGTALCSLFVDGGCDHRAGLVPWNLNCRQTLTVSISILFGYSAASRFDYLSFFRLFIFFSRRSSLFDYITNRCWRARDGEDLRRKAFRRRVNVVHSATKVHAHVDRYTHTQRYNHTEPWMMMWKKQRYIDLSTSALFLFSPLPPKYELIPITLQPALQRHVYIQIQTDNTDHRCNVPQTVYSSVDYFSSVYLLFFDFSILFSHHILSDIILVRSHSALFW